MTNGESRIVFVKGMKHLQKILYLEILGGFKELGVEEDIPVLAENAMKDATQATNPRRPSLEEVKQIIKNAM